MQPEGKWSARIDNLQKDKDKDTIFFVIDVTYIAPHDVSKHARLWSIKRRYSEFSDLNDQLRQLGVSLTFPSKGILNMDKDFLIKRQKGLESWLEQLVGLADTSPLPVQQLVMRFLQPEDYEKEKRSLAGKLLRKIVERKVTALKASGQKSDRHGSIDSQGTSVVVPNEKEDKDNITLRIFLGIMDVFLELNENQFVRRRIFSVLKTLVQATYGDSINRQLVAGISWMVSPEAVAGYMDLFKEAWWPDDIIAGLVSPRSEDLLTATRVEAKVKLFGVLPDELKRIVGQQCAKSGIVRFFDMLQYPRLNRRLFHVLLESFLSKLFEANKFPELFKTLYQHHRKVV